MTFTKNLLRVVLKLQIQNNVSEYLSHTKFLTLSE